MNETYPAMLPCNLTFWDHYIWYAGGIHQLIVADIRQGWRCFFYEHLRNRADCDMNTGNITIYSTRLQPESDEFLYVCSKSSNWEYSEVQLIIHGNVYFFDTNLVGV